MRIRFWGTRGSIAKAGASTVRYGGNTSCVEVRSAADTLVVLDCGTGGHGLGHALVNEQRSTAVNGNILISHTHWDHIQGLPFFAPLRVPGNEWDIYAPRGLSQSIREALAGQMQHTYFPITLEDLGATIHYHDLVEGDFQVGDIRVRARYLNHPALTLGYRLEADGVAVVYACDHEPHARHRPGNLAEIGEQDRRHAKFLTDADLVIHDTQYTEEEYPHRVGWGHSTIDYAVDMCLLAGVKRLVLTHHDPLRDDDAMDVLLRQARSRPDVTASFLEITAASEGMDIELEGARKPAVSAAPADYLATEAPMPSALWSHSVLLASSDGTAETVIQQATRAEGYRLIQAADAEAAMGAFERERPSLVVVDEHLPAAGALVLCRALRDLDRGGDRDVPVIVIGEREQTAAGRAAGVSDWLTPPFSEDYARARLRAWALRNAYRWARAPLPENEEGRLAAVQRLCLLDSQPEERFDRLTRIAAAAFDAPIALVSLMDSKRQWFKSRVGLDTAETPRDAAFCAHAILSPEPMVVTDALLDPRFAENPLVIGDPRVRFYAGYPLTLPDGNCVGTLCVLDVRPRQPDPARIALLEDLGHCVERELVAGDAP